MSGPDFAVSKTGTTQANGRHDVGAAGSVLREPTGPTVPLNRLAPEAALRRLELTVVRRLEGFLQGDHLGLLPGPGSDLNDARIYVPGQDDVRRMDWAVTARTTVPHVRDTMADRELEVWALLDATPSMNWGTAGVTKSCSFKRAVRFTSLRKRLFSARKRNKRPNIAKIPNTLPITNAPNNTKIKGNDTSCPGK